MVFVGVSQQKNTDELIPKHDKIDIEWDKEPMGVMEGDKYTDMIWYMIYINIYTYRIYIYIDMYLL